MGFCDLLKFWTFRMPGANRQCELPLANLMNAHIGSIALEQSERLIVERMRVAFDSAGNPHEV